MTITNLDFIDIITQAKEPVWVKFKASWCSPCSRYAQIFDEFVEENDLQAIEIDIDENPELAANYDVTSIPTTLVFDGGYVVDSVYGKPLAKPALRKMLEKVQ